MSYLQKIGFQFDESRGPEIVELLKSSSGPQSLRRVRIVRTGEYMVRIVDKTHRVVAATKPLKSEAKSIEIYQNVLKVHGHKNEPVPPKSGGDFFSDLGSEDDEGDFFAELEEDEADFFGELDELDFFGELDELNWSGPVKPVPLKEMQRLAKKIGGVRIGLQKPPRPSRNGK